MNDFSPAPVSIGDARLVALQVEERLPDLLDNLRVQGVELLLAVYGKDCYPVVPTLYLYEIHATLLCAGHRFPTAG
jgi:hypothetical protein